MNNPPPISLLQLVPEPLPTFRADVAVLFGKYLPRHGGAMPYCRHARHG